MLMGLFLFYFMVGLLGIEPSPHAPEACILPVYYSPKIILHAILRQGSPADGSDPMPSIL